MLEKEEQNEGKFFPYHRCQNSLALRSINNDSLNYNLYLDAAGQFVWDNGTNSQQYISPVSIGSVTIYGIIPAKQNVKIGNYTDIITATINF